MDTWRSKEDPLAAGDDSHRSDVVRQKPEESTSQPASGPSATARVPTAGAYEQMSPTEPSPELPQTLAEQETQSSHTSSRPSLPTTECPSEHDVHAFLDGSVSTEKRSELSTHIDECSACLELVGILAAASRRGSSTDFGTFWPTTIGHGATLAGRFDVQRFVDRGGMGEVYEAFDRNLQERVALKTMLCTSQDATLMLQQLRDEVRLARRIAHRNVCRIHELHEHHSAGSRSLTVQFVAMEFVDGETLKARLASGPLPLEQAVSIARQLLDGLEAAHAAGVLHLDFKSHNVLLRANAEPPEPVIMDFGLARAFDVEERLHTSQRHVAGSAGYISPEQIQCRPAGPRSDLYAFGVVLFEMLTGRLPFEGDTAASIMMKQLKSRTPSASRVHPDLPECFDSFLTQLLHRDPKHRPADVVSARRTFEACVRESLAPQRVRRMRRLTAAAALLTLAVGGCLLLWNDSGPTTDQTTTQALRGESAAAVARPRIPEPLSVAPPAAESAPNDMQPKATPGSEADLAAKKQPAKRSQADDSTPDPGGSGSPKPQAKQSRAATTQSTKSEAPPRNKAEVQAEHEPKAEESAGAPAPVPAPAMLDKVAEPAGRQSKHDDKQESAQSEASKGSQTEAAPKADAPKQEEQPKLVEKKPVKPQPPPTRTEPPRTAPPSETTAPRPPRIWQPGVPRDLL